MNPPPISPFDWMDMIAWSCVFALALVAMLLDRARTIHKRAHRRARLLLEPSEARIVELTEERDALARQRDRLDDYVHELDDNTGTVDAAIALIEKQADKIAEFEERLAARAEGAEDIPIRDGEKLRRDVRIIPLVKRSSGRLGFDCLECGMSWTFDAPGVADDAPFRCDCGQEYRHGERHLFTCVEPYREGVTP